MKNFLKLLMIGLFVSGCSNDDAVDQKEANTTKVIFGGVYGMCGGDCRDLYMINKSGLYKDADSESDQYGDWSNTTFDGKLSQEQFADASELLNIPTELLQDDLPQKDLVQAWADIDYYIYIEKNGKSQQIILDHIHPDANPEVKEYFKKFLKRYKNLGGSIIDTTNIERYY